MSMQKAHPLIRKLINSINADSSFDDVGGVGQVLEK
jgi:hypothetical protein